MGSSGDRFLLEEMEPRLLLSADPVAMGAPDEAAVSPVAIEEEVLCGATSVGEAVNYDPVGDLSDQMVAAPVQEESTGPAEAEAAASAAGIVGIGLQTDVPLAGDEVPLAQDEPCPENVELAALASGPAILEETLVAPNPPPADLDGLAADLAAEEDTPVAVRNRIPMRYDDPQPVPLNSTPLSLAETPAGSGYLVAFGSGSYDVATANTNWSEIDYWSFSALAGDVVTLSIDTPASSYDPYFQLLDSADTVLASNDNEGPDTDALISSYTIASSGTYYLKVGKYYYSTATGAYEVRVDLARGISIESDSGYANDAVGSPNTVPLAAAGNQRSGTVAGTVMASEGSNTDEDRFRWGNINAGVTVELNLRLPSYSTLVGTVTLVAADGSVVADTDGNATDGHFLAVMPADGDYQAMVVAVSGAGYRAQYLLDIDLTDPVAPRVTGVAGVPAAGGTTDMPVGSFTVSFSEDLAAAAANTVNPLVYWYGGHAYLLDTTARTWAAAEGYAAGLGGHLVSFGSEAEWAAAARWMGAWEPWIGLSDAAVEESFAWSDGTALGTTHWGKDQPYYLYGGDDYDYVHMTGYGLWYTNQAGATHKSVIEIDAPVDADGDKVPDVVDVWAGDGANAWDLREAGADGAFGTGDDVVYTLELASAYASGLAVGLRITDGPLGDGHYRLTANSRLADRVGNALDGNGDGTGGDAFVREFFVALPAGGQFEGRGNRGLKGAVALSFTEAAAGGGVWVARGYGSQDPIWGVDYWDDADWWVFDGLAGEKVGISVDTLGVQGDSRFDFYRWDGLNMNSIGTWNDGGPGYDAALHGYTLPASATYVVVVNKYYGAATPFSYWLRVEKA